MYSPFFVLATTLAYIIDADTITAFEEKAGLVALFGKHVTRGEMSEAELHGIIDDAFDQSRRVGLDRFLEEVTEDLTPGQRYSIVINVYEFMLIDGTVATGERAMLDRVVAAFEIDRQTLRAIREVLMLKNDTGLFTDFTHPFNEPSYAVRLRLQSGEDTDQPPVLTYGDESKKK